MNSRRNFLQKLTLSAASFPLISSLQAKDTPFWAERSDYQGPVLRVAIMGLGSYGT